MKLRVLPFELTLFLPSSCEIMNNLTKREREMLRNNKCRFVKIVTIVVISFDMDIYVKFVILI